LGECIAYGCRPRPYDYHEENQLQTDSRGRHLRRPHCLTPGSADDDPAAAGLKGRLAQSCILVADIENPDLPSLRGKAKGTLYYGRAALTPESPWPVRAYATGHQRFPSDRTSDQWFDHAQFDAYHLLGRHVGRATVTAAGIACSGPHPTAAPARPAA
jgi:hypothetical protein